MAVQPGLCQTWSKSKLLVFSRRGSYSLSQIITEPTHFTEHSSSLIDLLVLSNKDHILLSGVGDPFLTQQVRYHCPIYGIFKFSKPKKLSFKRHVWYYERGDYDLLRNKASEINWDTLQNEDIDLYANNIHNAVIEIASECIPNKEIKVKATDPPWITSSLKRHIRKRKRAYKRAKRSGSEREWRNFKHIRNTVVHMIREAKQSFHDKLANKLSSGTLTSKDWWSTLKYFIRPESKSTIPPIEHNDNIYTDEHDKANILNNYFQSQTILDDTNAILPDLPLIHLQSELTRIVLTPLEVKSILQSLPIGKASGPNGLGNRILRELASEVSVPYCCLFNQSLRTGTVPIKYKKANVCPVPKKGELSLVSNYRPISLLNSENKLFERLVFKYLFNHLCDNNLSSLKSGFIPGDSSVNQLTFLYNTFCKAIDSGKEVRAVFCDISKAFDRVWHDGLICKIRAAGVTGEVLAWFNRFLSNRRQRVVLPGANSDWVFIRAVVPQGSILGPLLFLLYINDIVLEIKSNIRLFADDTSLFIVVENPFEAADILNNDLAKITRWAWTVARFF